MWQSNDSFCPPQLLAIFSGEVSDRPEFICIQISLVPDDEGSRIYFPVHYVLFVKAVQDLHNAGAVEFDELVPKHGLLSHLLERDNPEELLDNEQIVWIIRKYLMNFWN